MVSTFTRSVESQRDEDYLMVGVIQDTAELPALPEQCLLQYILLVEVETIDL